MNYKNLNNIIGWVVFAIALFTYTATMEETVSLWDCGEYISTAFKLEVGHPPGAPLFNMLGRIFSAFVPTHNVAWSINFMSALVSAFTILFLFWSITHLAKKMATANGRVFDQGAILAVLGSGIIGALAYTFSDSFWFSAVEGEVYAMSSFFTAIVVWAIFRWETIAEEAGADRWLILIFFLVGLSIGVHLLNLLAIPAIGYIYYFRKVKQTTPRGVIVCGIVSMAVLGFIQAILIPGMVSFPAAMEQIFRNDMGLPFNVGLIFFFALLIALIVFGLHWTRKRGNALVNTIINSFIVLCIGYSCFFMIPIRSAANTPIDENNPENAISLYSYLQREQYGSWPILYGPYWNSAVDVDNEDGVEDGSYTVDGKPVYMRGFAVKRDGELVQGFRTQAEAEAYVKQKGLTGVDINEEYFMSDDRKAIDYRYKSAHMTIFPRMFSREDRHIHGYKLYSGYDPNDAGEEFTDPLTGKTEALPTFGNNLYFFFNYQVGWMYWRYFMWNFAGRQNDEQGIGPGPVEGNWISGVNFIDNEHVGDQSKLPYSFKRNRAYNRFYMLPLILGLIGFIFHLVFARKDWFIILLLFIFTGFMIIVYLNPKPYEPRERDYAYAGSFYAFAFWIGLGIWALYDAARRIKSKQLLYGVGWTVLFGMLILFIEQNSGNGATMAYSIIYIALVGGAMFGIMLWLGSNKIDSKMLALVAILLGAPVPILMGSQGWDDHDRSNRTTALDFAANFLETCEKDAIMFTHGDNDTFPLWYAQEVEGIRTDVRVVNLSLLGTDWYIDQMLRKAYDSDPVPFTAPEYMYRQGGLLDYVSLSPPEVPKGTPPVYVDLKKAMKDVMNDDNARQARDGRKLMVIESRTFSLDVDKSLVEKYSVVKKSEMSDVVSQIKFAVPKTSLYKNDLMILDLIANNNWKRPVYFAGGADAKTYLGLQNYFSCEGLAYRFVPIESPDDRNPNTFGKVNVERMYDNIMKKYKWGNMQTKGVNVDYYIRRTMTNNYRIMFYTLAQELTMRGRMAENADRNIKILTDSIAKGGPRAVFYQTQLDQIKKDYADAGTQKEKNFKMAKDVIYKCLEVMPEYNVPYDRIMPSFVELLYQIGDQKKAREIADVLVKQETENFEYFISLEPRFCTGVLEGAQVSWRIMLMLEKYAHDSKDTEREDAFKARRKTMRNKLLSWFQACVTDNQEYYAAFAEYLPEIPELMKEVEAEQKALQPKQ